MRYWMTNHNFHQYSKSKGEILEQLQQKLTDKMSYFGAEAQITTIETMLH